MTQQKPVVCLRFLAKDVRAADMLPARNLGQPMVAGRADGQIVELAPILDEYYAIMGWGERGVPTPQRVREWQLINGGLKTCDC